MSKELTLSDKLRLLRFNKVGKQYLENKYWDELEAALEAQEKYIKEAEREHEEYLKLEAMHNHIVRQYNMLCSTNTKENLGFYIIKKKRVNVALLKHLLISNPEHALEIYNREMIKAWDNLYTITNNEFETLKDFLE